MTSEEVIRLYKELENLGIKIWIDGGWGVDALVGKQSRPHKDLDIALEQKNVRGLRQFLEEQGYGEMKEREARAWNFVLSDKNGREIDIHVIVIDEHGNGIYGPPGNGEMYPEASLTGTGSIDGLTVRCISPEWAVNFHAGYELKEKDFHDVSMLCEKFGIELPHRFAKFKE